jgi:hypothetical protein
VIQEAPTPKTPLQKMLDAVEKATRGHVGMYDVQGHYLGGCSCGLECSSAELVDHLDDIIGYAAHPFFGGQP